MESLVAKENLEKVFAGKKVFITGHTGFKGSWLSLWLYQLGSEVKGYALSPEYENCLYNLIKPFNILRSTISDIRNKEKLHEEIAAFQPDFIFHLAAQPLVRRSYKIPAETFEVNTVGTANLLEGVNKLQKKCTVLIITTDKVYENKEHDILYRETDRLGGYDPYSASKACTEMVANSFRNSFFNIDKYALHQKSIATVRAGNVIGGGDFIEDRIIPDIIRALKSQKIIAVRNPNAIRPWQHVLEPLGGYLLLAGLMDKDPLFYSGAYNFGPNANDHLTVKELVELSIKNWGSGNWKDTSDKNQPHEAEILKLDISKAKEKLQWKPKLDAPEAVGWTIEWYKKNKNEAADYAMHQINNYMSR
ncbi:MAG: CDP-glucose 4,6-dehydratase [Bacteroidota bacterium]|nr:CDP-glucose 4,6-dehydratase [Bacteroidota bacterium]